MTFEGFVIIITCWIGSQLTVCGIGLWQEKEVGFRHLPHREDWVIAYASAGIGTFFGDMRDPDPCFRRVFAFHQPLLEKMIVARENGFRQCSPRSRERRKEV